ncbi:MAG: YfhO family protein [Deltaproteobacteria bacterium]|nr:YfhO family protein [Deltaproteobacteria bacterium]
MDDVTPAVAGLLIVTDACYPGWVADVDEVDVRILRADYGFRSVTLPASTHRAQFRYRSRSLCIAMADSLGALLLVLVVLLPPGRAAEGRAA